MGRQDRRVRTGKELEEPLEDDGLHDRPKSAAVEGDHAHVAVADAGLGQRIIADCVGCVWCWRAVARQSGETW
jgi:hypothetical protein